MAFQVKSALVVLTITVLAAALLGVGCGSGGDDGSERAVDWKVERRLGPKEVRLSAVLDEACSPAPPLLEPPIIEYMGKRVEIELRRTPELYEDRKGCFLNLIVAHKKITLKRDLDELVLFDSSTDPPEQRWPRKRRPGK